jgi:hypothetical protein
MAQNVKGGRKMVDETTNETTDVNKSQEKRDPNLVYPSIPPKSPHFCWLNIIPFLAGIAQIIFGQTAKGAAIIGVAIIFWFIELGWVINILSIIDAYMVGKVLQSGRPVGQWQFFPN